MDYQEPFGGVEAKGFAGAAEAVESSVAVGVLSGLSVCVRDALGWIGDDAGTIDVAWAARFASCVRAAMAACGSSTIPAP